MGKGVELVQTTPLLYLPAFEQALETQRLLLLATGTEVDCLHALGGAFCIVAAGRGMQLRLASTELVAWVHDTRAKAPTEQELPR